MKIWQIKYHLDKPVTIYCIVKYQLMKTSVRINKKKNITTGNLFLLIFLLHCTVILGLYLCRMLSATLNLNNIIKAYNFGSLFLSPCFICHLSLFFFLYISLSLPLSPCLEKERMSKRV